MPTGFADRARRFLAGREDDAADGLSSLRWLSSRAVELDPGSPRPGPGGERSDESDGTPGDQDGPTVAGGTAAGSVGRERSGRSEESPAAFDPWWEERLPEGTAPIRHRPPAACFVPAACARLGPCDRHAAGAPCQVDR